MASAAFSSLNRASQTVFSRFVRSGTRRRRQTRFHTPATIGRSTQLLFGNYRTDRPIRDTTIRYVVIYLVLHAFFKPGSRLSPRRVGAPSSLSDGPTKPHTRYRTNRPIFGRSIGRSTQIPCGRCRTNRPNAPLDHRTDRPILGPAIGRSDQIEPEVSDGPTKTGTELSE